MKTGQKPEKQHDETQCIDFKRAFMIKLTANEGDENSVY